MGHIAVVAELGAGSVSLRADADDSKLSWQERRRRQELLDGLVRDPREACHKLERDPEITVDIETSGLSPFLDKIATVQLYGVKTGTKCLLHLRGQVPQYLMDFLSEDRELNFHNGVGFDLMFLANAGMDIDGPRYYDTLVGECTVVASDRRDIRKSLQASVKRRLGTTIDKDIEHGGWMNPVLTEKQVLYGIGDVTKLHLLKEEQLKVAREHGMMRAIELEMAIIPEVVRMTLNGLPFSVDRLLEYLEQQRRKAIEARGRIFEAARPLGLNPRYKTVYDRETFKNGKAKPTKVLDPSAPPINLNTPAQKVALLNHVWEQEYGPEYEGTSFDGSPKRGHFKSSGKPVLLDVAMSAEEGQPLTRVQQLAEDLLVASSTGQRQKVWSEAWAQRYAIRQDDPGWEFVHARFWQAGTDTFRFSSSDPNLQQVPRDMRWVFQAPEGHKFVACDYAQIEVRVAAAIHHDRNMLRAIAEGTSDLHAALAAQMNGLEHDVDWEAEPFKSIRKRSKAQVFTLLFGGWWPLLYDYARLQGIRCTPEDAKEWHDQFFDTFPDLRQGKIDAFSTAKRARAGGYPIVLRLANSARRVLMGPSCRGTVILNTMAQSTAGVGIKYGILECRKRGLTHIGGQVHDELDSWVPENEAEEYAVAKMEAMIEGMHKVVDVKVGVEASIGPSWGEADKHLRAAA